MRHPWWILVNSSVVNTSHLPAEICGALRLVHGSVSSSNQNNDTLRDCLHMPDTVLSTLHLLPH